MIGFFVVSNYAEKDEKKTRVYDLGDELKIETGKVYDYGVYNGRDNNAMNGLIDSWVDSFKEYSKNNIEDWIFVYGNESSLKATTISTVNTGRVGINIGGAESGIDIVKDEKKTDTLKLGANKEVKVRFLNSEHTFNLKEGQNFYFIIKKDGYVARG